MVCVCPGLSFVKRAKFRHHQAAGKPGGARVIAVHGWVWAGQYQPSGVLELVQARQMVRACALAQVGTVGNIFTDYRVEHRVISLSMVGKCALIRTAIVDHSLNAEFRELANPSKQKKQRARHYEQGRKYEARKSVV